MAGLSNTRCSVHSTLSFPVWYGLARCHRLVHCEGLDCSKLDTLFPRGIISIKGRLVQDDGRVI